MVGSSISCMPRAEEQGVFLRCPRWRDGDWWRDDILLLGAFYFFALFVSVWVWGWVAECDFVRRCWGWVHEGYGEGVCVGGMMVRAG
jgi:hypothetical protein